MNTLMRYDDLDEVILEETLEIFDTLHASCETVALELERGQNYLSNLQALKALFNEMLGRTYKLQLIQFTEALDETLKIISKLIDWDTCPKQLAEFILLINDRIYHLAHELQATKSVDVEHVQQILISLQHIVLVENPNYLKEAISKSICILAKDIVSDETNDSMLFDSSDVDKALEEEDVFFFGEEQDNILTLQQAFEHDTRHATLEGSDNPVLIAKNRVDIILRDTLLKGYHRLSEKVTGHHHGRAVMELSMACNVLAGNPFNEKELIAGICLHDIALISIPEILSKKEKLTLDEVSTIRMHSEQGAKLATELGFSDVVSKIVYDHHERVDGRGYPNGKKGGEISEAGKLLAIVDSFNAMVNQRPYKKNPKSIFRAICEINACSGTQYDEQWVKIFNAFLRNYWLAIHRNEEQKLKS